VAGLALVTTACGGGSASPPVASVGTATSPAGGTTVAGTKGAGGAAPSFEPYATCLTQHGVAASSPSGRGIQITGGIDPNSPQFAAAQKACQKLAPRGGPAPLSSAQLALRTKGLIAFSRCVRKHGVPGFPDPDPNSAFAFDGAGASQLNTPLGRAAFKACHSFFPKIGPQISLGPGTG
jgi:hypothetical protein